MRDGREVRDVGEVREVGVVSGLVQTRGPRHRRGPGTARPGVATHGVLGGGERAHVEHWVLAATRRTVHLNTECTW